MVPEPIHVPLQRACWGSQGRDCHGSHPHPTTTKAGRAARAPNCRPMPRDQMAAARRPRPIQEGRSEKGARQSGAPPTPTNQAPCPCDPRAADPPPGWADRRKERIAAHVSSICGQIRSKPSTHGRRPRARSLRDLRSCGVDRRTKAWGERLPVRSVEALDDCQARVDERDDVLKGERGRRDC